MPRAEAWSERREPRARLLEEAHDTHHPIAVSLYYEDQRDEAKRRAGEFVRERIPLFFRYFTPGSTYRLRGYAADARAAGVDRAAGLL